MRIDNECNKMRTPEFTVDLKHMLTSPDDESAVRFCSVPKSAFKTVKYLNASGKMHLY